MKLPLYHPSRARPEHTGAMDLRVDERTENPRPCLDCGLSFPHITGYVYGSDGPVAVYFALTHTHVSHAARIDMSLGTWGLETRHVRHYEGHQRQDLSPTSRGQGGIPSGAARNPA